MMSGKCNYAIACASTAPMLGPQRTWRSTSVDTASSAVPCGRPFVSHRPRQPFTRVLESHSCSSVANQHASVVPANAGPPSNARRQGPKLARHAQAPAEISSQPQQPAFQACRQDGHLVPVKHDHGGGQARLDEQQLVVEPVAPPDISLDDIFAGLTNLEHEPYTIADTASTTGNGVFTSSFQQPSAKDGNGSAGKRMRRPWDAPAAAAASAKALREAQQAEQELAQAEAYAEAQFAAQQAEARAEAEAQALALQRQHEASADAQRRAAAAAAAAAPAPPVMQQRPLAQASARQQAGLLAGTQAGIAELPRDVPQLGLGLALGLWQSQGDSALVSTASSTSTSNQDDVSYADGVVRSTRGRRVAPPQPARSVHATTSNPALNVLASRQQFTAASTTQGRPGPILVLPETPVPSALPPLPNMNSSSSEHQPGTDAAALDVSASTLLASLLQPASAGQVVATASIPRQDPLETLPATITSSNWALHAAQLFPQLYDEDWHSTFFEFVFELWPLIGKAHDKGKQQIVQRGYAYASAVWAGGEERMRQGLVMSFMDVVWDWDGLMANSAGLLPAVMVQQAVVPLLSVFHPVVAKEYLAFVRDTYPTYTPSRRVSAGWRRLLLRLQFLQAVYPACDMPVLLFAEEFSYSSKYGSSSRGKSSAEGSDSQASQATSKSSSGGSNSQSGSSKGSENMGSTSSSSKAASRAPRKHGLSSVRKDAAGSKAAAGSVRSNNQSADANPGGKPVGSVARTSRTKV